MTTIDSGPLPMPTLLYGESQPMPRVSGEPPYRTPPSNPPPTPASNPPATPRATPTPLAGQLDEDVEEIALVPLAERRRWIFVGGAIMLSLVVVIAVLRSSSRTAVAPLPAAVVTPAVVPAPAPPAPALPPAPIEKAVAPAIVVVNTNVDDAHIELDGAVVAASARNVRLEVARAGEHELVVTAAGKKPFKKRIVTTPGGVVEMPVSLRSGSTSGSRPAKAKSKNDNGYYMLNPLGTTQVR